MTTTRDTCLQWWAQHPNASAAAVARHFNGPGRSALPDDARQIKAATLRQWKARHGLPAAAPAPATSAPHPELAKAAPAPQDPATAESLQPAAVWVELSTVVPWEDNPRDNDDAATRVAESIARFGYGRAFVGWRPDGERMLVVGHTARKATLHLIERRPVYAFQCADTGHCRECGQPAGGRHAAGCSVAVPPEVPREGLIPMRWRADWTEAEARGYALADNQLGTLAGWVPSMLAQQLADLQQHDMGHALLGWSPDQQLQDLLDELNGRSDPGPGSSSGKGDGGVSLAARFGVPPFSLLDARRGYWKDRKRQWLALGIQSELGREGLGDTTCMTTHSYMADRVKSGDAGSIFDPVLQELAVRWFAPEGGRVLDPFAGGSVRGVVSACLGYDYTGVDLREEQVQANRVQWHRIAGEISNAPGGLSGADLPPPTWLQGDSRHLDDHLPEGHRYDLVATCPPYGDLEVYSDDPADISTMEWAEFVEAYRQILAAAVRRLRPDRFVVVVVGDVRDKSGCYRGLVRETEQALEDAGARLYNHAIYVTPAGTIPIRAGGHFLAGRKLAKTHQNVIVGYTGDPRKIRDALGEPPQWVAPNETETED